MIARVFKYSFAQARARSLKGKLLSPDDWHYLLKMKRLEDILKYLGGTEYAVALSRLSGAPSHAGTICLALYDELFNSYARLIKAVPRRSSRVLRDFLLLYEAENIKTILRGAWQGKAPSEVRVLLYRLGPLSRLPIEELLEARQITAAVDLLKPTLFHLPLLHALPQFEAQGRLFPLEMAMDTAVLDHIVAGLKSIRGADRRGIEILVGEWIDIINVSWLVRFRHFYGQSPEEAINYTVSGGYRLGARDLGAVARSPDLPSFLSALPRPYHEPLGETQRWEQVHASLGRWFVGELYRVFSRDPFQIRLPLSYLLLKEIEVKSLESLISAVELGEPAGRLVDLIGLPVRGGVRV